MPNGAEIIAHFFAKQSDNDPIYGLVGIPITLVAEAFLAQNRVFIGCRNEQAASHAAAAHGFLNQRPGVALVVGGPGFIHALAGIYAAHSNCWPLVVLVGGPASEDISNGAFQECPVAGICSPISKYYARIDSKCCSEKVLRVLETAYFMAGAGRPGPTIIELAADWLIDELDDGFFEKHATRFSSPLVRIEPESSIIRRFTLLLLAAKAPLVIVGKGAAQSRAEDQLAEFVRLTNFPILPMPMAKGMLPDGHPSVVSAARSMALREADLILMIGARWNWMLGFGSTTTINADAKIVRVDVLDAHDLENLNDEAHKLSELYIQADATRFLEMTNVFLRSEQQELPDISDWRKQLAAEIEHNSKKLAELVHDTELPLSYHCAFMALSEVLPQNSYVVSEGSNTMDIGRIMLPIHKPRHRLDAGTMAAMGVGPAYAIAAAITTKLCEEDDPVFLISGDSAFGFSAMELETMARYRLPIVIVIFNNSGIYQGISPEDFLRAPSLLDIPIIPSTALMPGIKYEKVAEAIDAFGANVHTVDELKDAVRKALSLKRPGIINVCIRSSSFKCRI